jgi:hypothetical protein
MSSRTTHSNFLRDLCQFACKGFPVVACTASVFHQLFLFSQARLCFLIATDSHMRRNSFPNNFFFSSLLLSVLSLSPFCSTCHLTASSMPSVSMRFLSASCPLMCCIAIWIAVSSTAGMGIFSQIYCSFLPVHLPGSTH